MDVARDAGKLPGNPYAWTDLGPWNLYFLTKFAMVWMGMLDFHLLPNLLFAALLLLPLQVPWQRRLRLALAIPAGIALFYYDTWLPPFSRLLAQPGVLDFSFAYLLQLAGRFINWQLIGAIAVLVLGYVLLRPWLRITTFSVLGLLGLGLAQLPWPVAFRHQAAPVQVAAEAGVAAPAVPQGPADTATLNAYLQSFYQSEAGRRTQFAATADGQPFDLLILNICSLAWSDLDEVGLRENALLQRMDVVFDRFNSATSYSGPAAIRLLRASCGQTPHGQLYDPAPAECYLFGNLARLGFRSELAMNHDGHFDDFIGELREDGGLDATAFDIGPLPRAYLAFDQTPIRRDGAVLSGWWQQRQQQPQAQVALFYNSISLHDGNRVVVSGTGSRPADYRTLAQSVIDDLSAFLDELQASGRRVMVVLVPEHGAALQGDRMQIPGLREIPSPSITQVPVAMKLIGMGTAPANGPRRVDAPSSYLALSELVARVHAGGGDVQDWDALLRDLPQTAAVSESAGARVLDYAGKPYVQIQGRNSWMPYPENKK